MRTERQRATPWTASFQSHASPPRVRHRGPPLDADAVPAAPGHSRPWRVAATMALLPRPTSLDTGLTLEAGERDPPDEVLLEDDEHDDHRDRGDDRPRDDQRPDGLVRRGERGQTQ